MTVETVAQWGKAVVKDARIFMKRIKIIDIYEVINTYAYSTVHIHTHKISIIKDENPPSKKESKVSSKVKAKIALDAIKLRAFERQRARKCNLILIGLGLKANKAEKSLRGGEESLQRSLHGGTG